MIALEGARVWTHEGRPELAYGGATAVEGPWDDEPDKVHWIDPATNMDCLAVRSHMGMWCGYVAVTEGHPLYGVSYNQCPKSGVCKEREENSYCDHAPESQMSVHGGLTYSAFCVESEEGPGYSICHVPFDGRPEKVWWLGFDCGHAFDLIPGMLAWEMKTMPDLAKYKENNVYRTLEYVVGECENLAAQLKKIN